MRFKLMAALGMVLGAAPAWAQSSVTYMRHRQGATVPFDQVDCTTGGTDVVVATNVASYDRLSILIKNCDPSGGSSVAICPNDATCSATDGFLLDPREGMWIDWSTDGAIGCIGVGGTATVCYVEERG